jgi:hypothetical protein
VSAKSHWVRVKYVQGNDWNRKNTLQHQAVSRVTRCGRSSVRSLLGAVVCCAVARYDASDCCAAVVNLRALRWPASLGHTSSSLGHTSGAVGVIALG